MNFFLLKMIVLLLLSSFLSALSIYEDKNSHIAPSEIDKYEERFYPNESNSFAYSDSTFWLKFDFSLEKEGIREKYILFNSALINHIDMYYRSNSELKVLKGGAKEPKQFPFNEIVFRIPLEIIDDNKIYFRVKHKGVLSLEHKIFDSKKELRKTLMIRDDMTMIFISIACLTIFFIAVLSYYIKQQTYRFYLIFLFFITMVYLTINNSLAWLFPLEKIDIALQVFIDLALATLYLFIMHLTKMKEDFAKIYKLFKLVVIIALYMVVVELFNIKEIYIFKNMFLIPLFISIIILYSIYMLYKKAKYSFYIFMALFFLAISTSMIILNKYGFITGMYYPVMWKFFIIMMIITFSLLMLYIIKELSEAKRKNELILEEQSKLVVIGETLTNIEHQWRSPLSKISSNIVALETELEIKGNISNQRLRKSLHNMTNTLDYMTSLVDYFKVFYMKDDNKEPFFVGNAYLRVSRLLEYDFLKMGINVEYIDDSRLQVLGHINEFTQVILNILSNSRDIFKQREIINPKIKIKVFKKDRIKIITIEDNAGGISEEDIDEVFNQFFSAKKAKSSGIGLYLCKHIVENKMNGSITVANKNEGAVFTIKF